MLWAKKRQKKLLSDRPFARIRIIRHGCDFEEHVIMQFAPHCRPTCETDYDSRQWVLWLMGTERTIVCRLQRIKAKRRQNFFDGSVFVIMNQPAVSP
jgi:hypothetical protein